MAALSAFRMLLISLATVFVHRLGRPIEWVWAALVTGAVASAAVALPWMLRGIRQSG